MDFLGIERDELLAKWQWVLELTDRISSWTSGHELAALAEMASRSHSLLEVGSHHGKSALVMALANPNCQLICIDICENHDTEHHFRTNLKSQLESGQVVFVKGTSDWLKGKNPLILDGCFIDGGHLEHHVRTDIENLLPHMKEGALMTGHDWRPRDMNDGVNLAVVAAFGQPKVFESVWNVRLT